MVQETSARRPADLDELLDRFEQSWRQDSPPEIEEFLAAAGGPDAAPLRRKLLTELMRIDLWYRWRRSGAAKPAVDLAETRRPEATEVGPQSLPSRPMLEDYSRKYTDLGPPEDTPLELIGEEYRVRRSWGAAPDHESYRMRFPKHGPELENLLAEIDKKWSGDTARPAETIDMRPPVETPASPPVAKTPTPQRIGKYHVVGVLDEGGQAKVYRAVHPTLAQEVVIKVDRHPNQTGPLAAERLQSEGRILAELVHPNLARVFDLDWHEGCPYLVMEYIRGLTLGQYAEQHPPEPSAAARLVAKICRALAVAHSKGVVHQDIKPKNIIVDESGEPHLLDFGLAQLHNAWATDSWADGLVVGTLQYMAPEQAAGDHDRIGPRSDLFAVGAVLYALLVNKPPFEGRTVDEVLGRARRCDFDADALVQARVPAALRRICLRAMSVEPADRYDNAEQMAAELERFAAGPRIGRRALVLALGLTLVALGLLSWQFVSGRSRFNPARLLGRPLRQDFRLQVGLLGQPPGTAEKIMLEPGERFILQLEADRDCYVGVWHVDAKGNVLQLFPNQYDDDNLVRAGKRRTVPGNAEYAVKATPSVGFEYLHVVASTERWESETGQRLGPYVMFATPEERKQWERKVRGIVLENQKGPAVSEHVLPFEVHAR